MTSKGVLALLATLAAVVTATDSRAQLPPPIWDNPPVQPIAAVEHKSFHSLSLDGTVGYNILLPPRYELEERRYPVVYWLHGFAGNENQVVPAVAPRVLAAMNTGALPPLIVVFINGPAFTFFADSPNKAIPAETVFIRELIPHVDQTYRTVPERRARAIEGMSMGGFGALVLAMKHVDLFGSVVAYAPALLEVQETTNGTPTLGRAGGTHAGAAPLTPDQVVRNTLAFVRSFGGRRDVFEKHSPWALLKDRASQLRTELRLRIVIGTTDGLWNANKLFHELMQTNGYAHEFEIVEGVGHSLEPLYQAVGIKGLEFHVRTGNWR